MTVRELREKYLAFFESKGHRRFPSGSLVPYDVTGRLDESLLFNGAGMIQFKPYFRGVARPDHPRLTTCQKCVRTGDIEEVGDDTHLTFFEMLGNFSFGDYFKADAIRFSWEFLTSPEWLGLDPARLSFTVFETDDEAEAAWRECGARLVVRLGEETNYWPAGAFSKGPPGPCGPNSEMFYWVGDGPSPLGGSGVPPECRGTILVPHSADPDRDGRGTLGQDAPATGAGGSGVPPEGRGTVPVPLSGADRDQDGPATLGQDARATYGREEWLRDEAAGLWVEIWNDVFIQYEWQGEPEGKGWRKTGLPELPFRSIDTGMGLERTAMVLSGKKSVYDTDAFTAILAAVAGASRPSVPRPSWSGSAPESGTGTVPRPSGGTPEPPEIVKRRGAYLPHWTKEGATYFVTFRLADSVPGPKRDEWRRQREQFRDLEAAGKTTVRETLEFQRAFSDKVEAYLDSGQGSCLLAQEEPARIVAEALGHFDGDRYRLHAWCVMPNHVHAVVEPLGENDLAGILHSWKSFTAKGINRALGREGSVWMEESYDHLVRDEGDLERVVRYTLENPAKAGLGNGRWVGGGGSGVPPEGRGTVPVPLSGDQDQDGPGTLGQDARATGAGGSGVPPEGRGTVPVPLSADQDQDGPGTLGQDARATRVIADHARTAVFCIGDGVLPANTGRGYVLRRLIRRAVLQGERKLGFADPFFARVGEAVIGEYGHHYRELEDQREVILETLRNEEALFRRTLRAGTERLESLLTADVSGEDAFRLYDTFGFPLEVTQELAAEAGVAVDVEGYERALREAQARSRGADERESVYGGVGGETEGSPEPTVFLGYDALEAEATVTGLRRAGGRTLVAFDRTPFYAESGGQVGDTGVVERGSGVPPEGRGTILVPLSGADQDQDDPDTLGQDARATRVTDVTKAAGVHWHATDAPLALGERVRLRVDGDRRRRIRAHHTATHLLHLALRETLGSHATQAGSSVGPDRLRFDFTHGAALTPEQREVVEARVIQLALANPDVTTWVDISPAEARERGAMALFGEKYGDRVRMVEVGPSKELCGGTHVRTAAEVLPFRILAESSAQSGVRRIEAVAGEAALELAREERRTLEAAAVRLKTTPAALLPALDRTVESLKEERAKRERAERAALSGNAGGARTLDVGGVALVLLDLGETDPKTAASAVDDAAAGRANQVTLGATAAGGRVQFIAKVGADALARGAHAGNLLREVARVAGGGGGGKAEFATAGGKDPAKVAEALASAEGVLRSQVG